MMNFMRDGGFTMWLMVATAIATLAVATVRGRDARSATFTVGTIAILIQGMLGMALGLAAVSKQYARFPDPLAAIGMGLGELSNNGTLAALIATAFGVAALATAKPPAALAR